MSTFRAKVAALNLPTPEACFRATLPGRFGGGDMNDRAHFDTYRRQTEVKHLIVEKYLFVFFNILKPTNKRLVYIDGFAGRGTYTDEHDQLQDGSPIRALKKVASLPDLPAIVRLMFIEQDPELCAHLRKSVDEFCAANAGVTAPAIFQGTFAQHLSALLDHVKDGGAKLAPAFLFADPCGVAGVSFEALKRFMANESCELLLFFNIEGVKRILGLQELGSTLPDLLGTKERAAELQSRTRAVATPEAKEQAILDYYFALLREDMGAKYITPFRVEKEDRKATSHYLIHVTNHPRGFRIMKEVMWSVGKTTEGPGGLAYEQASTFGGRLSLFRPTAEAIKTEIMNVLARGKQPVAHFSVTIPSDPRNLVAPKAYKEALLELETAGQIIVLNKSGSGVAPPRRLRNGKPTLADEYWVEAKGGAQ